MKFKGIRDIRDYQILFLSLFLVLGIGTRDWTLRPEWIALIIVTCLSTQWLLSQLLLVDRWWLVGKIDNQQPTSNNQRNIRSPLITALGLSLLLRADHWTTMVFAAVIAIASKFVFKIGDKHFFNPANFGIISALILTPDAWVSPGQWGEDWWYGLLFAGTGGMILKGVGRWDTTAAFLGSYAALEAMRNFYLGWTWDVYWHRLMSGSLLLFALFMVTDPRSIPNARIARVVLAVCIAILTFLLRNYFFVSTAVFWALFALAPLTVLLDVIWEAPRFGWDLGIGDREGRKPTTNNQQPTTNH
ncbi:MULTISPECIES: RnfABCDGE type electron transport complex subunit D [Fischerella]|uniref:Na+-transporting NADH:ubiquinone oxidoreductase, subunit NqrB n=1 Tax=Fischerella muscicola CCMEE 5323 TaxID=2019572 RepID=A0A2N6JU23_FISMU|nr:MULTISPECIES: RnfABCDGE type electron transport complex subunit D [Fischerella]MBD2431065.1 RnfABCDGE type electron transport complex subunit D [Fischerella sp. FACHB-380]PLZ80390.1 Na+-transporting NADH:ubiquinone oxidoreductase, subunit NqrB [Fischerella muscicola CCMEE 5323]